MQSSDIFLSINRDAEKAVPSKSLDRSSYIVKRFVDPETSYCGRKYIFQILLDSSELKRHEQLRTFSFASIMDYNKWFEAVDLANLRLIHVESASSISSMSPIRVTDSPAPKSRESLSNSVEAGLEERMTSLVASLEKKQLEHQAIVDEKLNQMLRMLESLSQGQEKVVELCSTPLKSVGNSSSTEHDDFEESKTVSYDERGRRSSTTTPWKDGSSHNQAHTNLFPPTPPTHETGSTNGGVRNSASKAAVGTRVPSAPPSPGRKTPAAGTENRFVFTRSAASPTIASTARSQTISPQAKTSRIKPVAVAVTAVIPKPSPRAAAKATTPTSTSKDALVRKDSRKELRNKDVKAVEPSKPKSTPTSKSTTAAKSNTATKSTPSSSPTPIVALVSSRPSSVRNLNTTGLFDKSNAAKSPSKPSTPKPTSNDSDSDDEKKQTIGEKVTRDIPHFKMSDEEEIIEQVVSEDELFA